MAMSPIRCPQLTSACALTLLTPAPVLHFQPSQQSGFHSTLPRLPTGTCLILNTPTMASCGRPAPAPPASRPRPTWGRPQKRPGPQPSGPTLRHIRLNVKQMGDRRFEKWDGSTADSQRWSPGLLVTGLGPPAPGPQSQAAEASPHMQFQ
ncbi:hypothetical protein AAFF_G00369370 [Aldrovandia affinis]|uniref:Uncharacterized protein n=1 Tax=Aldrovandia affinis TaxID=143900 RepID=A0AAD7WMR4_9TELE|nr:hypothetical protein AAFF_G00369370 [Aldrovandia affinis]